MKSISIKTKSNEYFKGSGKMELEKLKAFRNELNNLYEKYGFIIETDGGNESVFIDNVGGNLVLIEFEDGKYELYVRESPMNYYKITD
jgi:hypothetical protein